MTAISVGVPAYNEGASIVTTLHSIFAQDFAGDLEILVCFNGSTDDTEEQVRSLMDDHDNVSLIVAKKKGKPNAWNLLRERASHDYLFFLDGDVSLERDAFSVLFETLESTQLAAISGVGVPSSENGYLARLLELPFSTQQILIGRLYGMNNQKVTEILEAQGQPTMPEHIIHDDAWLSIMLGRGNYGIAEDATVHYHAYNLVDRFRIHRRNVRGYFQLKEEFPDQAQSFSRDSTAQRFKDAATRFRGFALAERLLGYGGRRLYDVAAAVSIIGECLDEPLKGWEVAHSTKKPVIQR